MSKQLKNCTVQTIIKPNACFKDVIECMVDLVKNYTINDFVIVLAGLNDFKNKKYPHFKDINNQIKHCTHTNIILASVPFYNFENKINNFVYKFNDKLNGYVFRLNRYAKGNIIYLELNNRKGFSITKNEIVKKIIKNIELKKNANKNLKFVQMSAVANMEHTFLDQSLVEVIEIV